jgi:hypothetical protein
VLSRVDALVDALFRLARSTETPSRLSRLAVAVVIASIAASFPYIRFARTHHPADFGLAWFSAQALLHGGDPYVLIGPDKIYDWPWTLIYPGTVMVAAMPLAWLPQMPATMTFVWISTLLLAYAVTAGGWFRVLMFFTPSFSIAASAAQWSPLLTASLFLPAIGFLLAAKPNIGLVFTICGSARLRRNAIVGGVLLTAISLALLPSWPYAWIHSVQAAAYEGAPVLRRGGFLILLALLRWRRPEARLLLLLACVPQSTYWYEALPLFLIPSSLVQMIVLASGCSVGALLEKLLLTTREDVLYSQQVGMLLVVFVYLPATFLILRRPNEKAPAPWSRKPLANP